MKKIAIIMILLFSAVVAGPAVISLISPTSVVFLMDEEKNEDNHKEDQKKDKKIFHSQYLQADSESLKLSFDDFISENILPSPFLEKVSPPPNFC